MQGKVALEEHFAIPETLQDSAGFAPEADWPELKGRLLDIQDRRLREMDAHGIEMMLLSLNAPAVQAISSVEKADEIARRSANGSFDPVGNSPIAKNPTSVSIFSANASTTETSSVGQTSPGPTGL